VVNALRADNIQVAAGSVGEPPFGQPRRPPAGRADPGLLTTPEQFGEIIVKRDSSGRVTRVSDVARVELGRPTTPPTPISAIRQGDGAVVSHHAAAVGILQLPGANGWPPPTRSRTR